MRGLHALVAALAAAAVAFMIGMMASSPKDPLDEAPRATPASAPDPDLARRVAALEARMEEMRGTLRLLQDGRPSAGPVPAPSPADLEAAVAAAIEKKGRDDRRAGCLREAELFLNRLRGTDPVPESAREAVQSAVADWYDSRQRARQADIRESPDREKFLMEADNALDRALRGLLPEAQAKFLVHSVGARPGQPLLEIPEVGDRPPPR